MFYTYILLSQKDNKLYVGCTNNIKKDCLSIDLEKSMQLKTGYQLS